MSRNINGRTSPSSESAASSTAGATSGPQLMSVSAHLQCAVEQCIDALCFSGTHVLDADLRAQPKASQSSLDRLVNEQHRRVDEAFGPASVSAEGLAIALDELFRIDAASITEIEPGVMGSPVVDVMTDTTAKIFKKEMKQRIHEWEGAFRAVHGREPNAQDKNRLRHIYELYRTVKARVLKLNPDGNDGVIVAAATTTTVGPPQIAAAPQSQYLQTASSSSTPRPNSAHAFSAGVSMNNTPVNNSSNNTRAPSPSLGGTQQQQQQQTPMRHGGGSSGGGAASGSVTPHQQLQQQPQHATAISSSTPSGLNVQLTPMNSGSQPNSGRGPSSQSQSRAATPTTTASGTPLVAASSSAVLVGGNGNQSLETLTAEKRSLKRRLHAFEADFQKQHGRAPTRDDRMPLLAQYQRYGELKLALQAHSGSADD